jgi:Glu-tRNA(Gln) amidotransferase subunit E-like FAD-binding protein
MTLDYQSLGFKCGIEIHQQLETHKLFCSCPSIIKKKDDKPDFVVKRKLRASAGELGKVDAAAMHELQKGKYFVYNCYKDCTCNVELDEQPPGPVNQEALNATLQIAKLLNANTVDEIHFMRKIVIDGSNTTGFQRTALVATDGWIETSEGKISIPTIMLEEEAAQIVERTEKYDVYNLSRLGLPLVEISTGTEIKSPQGAKEAAEKIGMILRSTAKVKRGLGTIRQDVNVSVKGGARTEVKGFQEIRSMPEVIENEIKRQLELIKKGEKVDASVRNANPDGTTTYLRPMPGAERMYPETDVAPIKPEIKETEEIELIDDKSARLQKTYSLGKDLADLIAKKHLTEVFESFASKFKNIKPAFIAETMLPTLKELGRQGVNIDLITNKHLEDVFDLVDKGKIAKESITAILKDIPEKQDVAKIVAEKNLGAMSDSDLEAELKKIVEANKSAPANALMGIAMKQLRGKASGQKISEILKKLAQ